MNIALAILVILSVHTHLQCVRFSAKGYFGKKNPRYRIPMTNQCIGHPYVRGHHFNIATKKGIRAASEINWS